MDPLSYFIYEEFFDPGMKYECRKCGTRFGDECVTWDVAAQCHVATCPVCGSASLVTDQLGDGGQ